MRQYRFFLLIAAACFLLSGIAAGLAEKGEPLQYPFGLAEDMTQQQAAEALRDRFGNMTRQNLPKGYVNYYIQPDDLAMGDFRVAKITVSSSPGWNWHVVLELEETDTRLLAQHFLALYAQLKETYGDPDAEPCDIRTEDTVSKSWSRLNVDLDDPEALAAELAENSGWHLDISYHWKDRVMYALEIFDYGTAQEYMRISLSWIAGNPD